MGGSRRALITVAVASALVTVLVVALPSLHYAYRAPRLHTALETASSLVALLAAFLVAGRVVGRARSTDLLVACALGLLTLTNLLFAVASASNHILGWDARVVAVLGALALAAAALTPRRALRRPRREAVRAGLAVGGLVAATATIVGLLGDRLPAATVIQSGRIPAWPNLQAAPGIAALHAVSAVAFAASAVGFRRLCERNGDGFFGLLAIAAVLAAFSSVNYALFPTRYSDWVYTGDGFRLGFYLVLLAAATWEIRSYWRSLAAAAVSEDRRRIARDLHDGLAQELAYISRNLAALDSSGADLGDRLERLQKAVDRARLESRRTLATLSAPADELLEEVLARSVGETADRAGVAAQLDLAAGIRLSALRTEALVRIACEAVTNAARHSGSPDVRVTLEQAGKGTRLSVQDAGRGFDPSAANGGFGLTSMRERARSIGAVLEIVSAPGEGTRIEVVV
jgi:signal transduction histidine kinase